MQALRIQSTPKTPEVLFDAQNEIFEIKGKSIPDDAEDFYSEVLQWFDDYVANPNQATVLKIDLEYFNIASSKRLLFLLYKLNEMRAKDLDVRVVWRYNKADEDMYEVGQDYAFMVKVPFDFIPYEVERLEPVMA